MFVNQFFSADPALKFRLEKRISEDSLRSLRITKSDQVDFCSNDYLGFAASMELARLISSMNVLKNGSTGSRLLAGNTELAEETEKVIAAYHCAESALIFNSGYDANMGLFSCLALRHDTILYDELSHASIIDGIRLSHANSFKFRHNDLVHLEELLKKAVGTIYVSVESVYSMSGDSAPLEKIVKLCEIYKANLIVDEAHATGVFGPKGEGMIVELGLAKKVFARVHTFGKVLGCHGAAVLGNNLLRSYLINFSRPFIYSTALPPHSLLSIKAAYSFLEQNSLTMKELHARIHFFRESVSKNKGINVVESRSAIQCVEIGGNTLARQIAAAIQNAGFDARAILSPTVPLGKECIRICLHSYNTNKQIEELLDTITKSIKIMNSVELHSR